MMMVFLFIFISFLFYLLKSYKFFDEGSVGTKADSCPLSTRESL